MHPDRISRWRKRGAIDHCLTPDDAQPGDSVVAKPSAVDLARRSRWSRVRRACVAAMVGFAVATGRAVVVHTPIRTNTPALREDAKASAAADLAAGIIMTRRSRPSGDPKRGVIVATLTARRWARRAARDPGGRFSGPPRWSEHRCVSATGAGVPPSRNGTDERSARRRPRDSCSRQKEARAANAAIADALPGIASTLLAGVRVVALDELQRHVSTPPGF
jgi:hypothetical protein